jgi:hypothetical protein
MLFKLSVATSTAVSAFLIRKVRLSGGVFSSLFDMLLFNVALVQDSPITSWANPIVPFPHPLLLELPEVSFPLEARSRLALWLPNFAQRAITSEDRVLAWSAHLPNCLHIIVVFFDGRPAFVIGSARRISANCIDRIA